MPVFDPRRADPGLERVERDSLAACELRRLCGQLSRAGRHAIGEAAPGDGRVDQAPLDGALALHPFGQGGERVCQVAPHFALVHHARESAGAGEDAKKRHLGQAHRRGAVVHQDDLVAGQRQLVAAARRGTVAGGQIPLPALSAGVFDREAGLVGVLAEVDLEGVCRSREHVDVGAGAEDFRVRRSNDDALHLRMLEPQPLDGVRQLDVDREIVRVALELELAVNAGERLHVEGEAGDFAVHLQLPVAVAAGVRLERQGGRGAELVHARRNVASREQECKQYCACCFRLQTPATCNKVQFMRRNAHSLSGAPRPKQAAPKPKRRRAERPPPPQEAARDELLGSRGALVRGLREQRGLTRRELAQSSGLSERFLADLEGGFGNISVARLAQLAHALGARAGQLLGAAEQGKEEPSAAISQLVHEAALPYLAGLSRDDLSEVQRWLRARFGPQTVPVVALLGLRGAGKSTIGRRLAERLGVPFVELDELVEKAAGLSLAGVFSLHGEAYYRRLAREVLARLLAEGEPAVLATGGSVVTDREAFRLLQKRCRTVWLQATPEDHWERVLQQGDVRPSAASPHAQEELRALLKAREPLYSQAEIAVDTSKLGTNGTVEALMEKLGARQAALSPD